MAHKYLVKELKYFNNDPPDGITAAPMGDDMYRWKATMIGPSDTPYEGGVFVLDIQFPQCYPFKPPKIRFETRIYHCSIDEQGNIKINMLKDQWSPAISIAECLTIIRDCLEEPNVDDPMESEIAKLYKENRKLHDVNANEMAHKYAQAPLKYSNEYMTQIRKSEAQRIEDERLQKELKFTIIKERIADIFGEVSIFYLVIAFDGTFVERLPTKVIDNFESERYRLSGGVVYIKTLNGQKESISCNLEDTVMELKERIERKMGINVENQRVIYQGKQLNNDKTLAHHQCTYGCTMYLVLRMR